MCCSIQTGQLTHTKSYCIRIGHRLNKPCYCITPSTGNGIAWSNSCKYFGVYPLVGRKFKCHSDEAKPKYYRTFNGVMGKVGRSSCQEIIIELMRVKCLNIIICGIEARLLEINHISSMEHILNCTFDKICIVKQQEIINECQNAFSLDNLNHIIKIRPLKFIAKLHVSTNIMCRLISSIQTSYISITTYLLFCHVTIKHYQVYHSLSLFIYLISTFVVFNGSELGMTLIFQ